MSDGQIQAEDDARSPPTASEVLARMRARLLDLSARNPLLNYRHPWAGCVRVVDVAPEVVIAQMLAGGRMTFTPVVGDEDRITGASTGTSVAPSLGDVPRQRTETRLKRAIEAARAQGINPLFDLAKESVSSSSEPRRRRDLQTVLFPTDLERILRRVELAARTAIQETGSNILYLAFGFLKWHEGDESTTPRSAPLLLLPVTLTKLKLDRATSTILYEISHEGDPAEANITLQEKLKTEFSIDLPLPQLGEGVEQYFARVRLMLSESPRHWSLERCLTLGLFSFGRLLMWKDLDPAGWPSSASPLSNPILADLLIGAAQSGPEPNAASTDGEPYDLDELPAQEVPPIVLDADSAQHSVLVDAMKGCNLVVQGPPGTGKSQTITNLIASAIGSGRTVLFMTQKLAALEVVARRLRTVGLDDFCLQLHSHRAKKENLFNHIARRANRSRAEGASTALPSQTGARERAVARLRSYIRSIHTPYGSIGLTPFKIFGRARRLHGSLPDEAARACETMRIPGIHSLTLEDVAVLKETTREYEAHLNGVLRTTPTLREHPWFGTTRPHMSHSDIRDLQKGIEDWQASLVALFNQAQANSIALRMPVPDAIHPLTRMTDCIRLLDAPPAVLAGTFLALIRNEEGSAALCAFLRDLEECQSAMETALPPFLAVLKREDIPKQIASVTSATEILGSAATIDSVAAAHSLATDWADTRRRLSQAVANAATQLNLALPVAPHELTPLLDDLDSFETPPTFLTEGLVRVLVDPSGRHLFGGFQRDLTIAKRLTSRVPPDCLQTLTEDVARTGHAELKIAVSIFGPSSTIHALVRTRDKIDAALTMLHNADKFTAAISEELGLAAECTPTIAHALRHIVGATATLGERAISLRRDAAKAPGVADVIRESAQRASSLRERRADLGHRFNIDLVPGNETLRACATTIASAPWYSFLLSEYRAARLTFRTISKDERSSRAQMRAAFTDLLAFSLNVERFNQDEHLVSVFGDDFRGIESPFDQALNVVNWRGAVEASVAGLGRLGDSIVECVWTAPGNVLRNIVRIADSRTGDSQAAASLLDALEEVRAECAAAVPPLANEPTSTVKATLSDLRGRASAIIDLAESLNVGLEQSLPSLVGLLEDAIAAHGAVARLDEYVGIARAIGPNYRGAATDVDDARRAESYVSNVLGSRITPDIQRWLLEGDASYRLRLLRDAVTQVRSLMHRIRVIGVDFRAALPESCWDGDATDARVNVLVEHLTGLTPDLLRISDAAGLERSANLSSLAKEIVAAQEAFRSVSALGRHRVVTEALGDLFLGVDTDIASLRASQRYVEQVRSSRLDAAIKEWLLASDTLALHGAIVDASARLATLVARVGQQRDLCFRVGGLDQAAWPNDEEPLAKAIDRLGRATSRGGALHAWAAFQTTRAAVVSQPAGAALVAETEARNIAPSGLDHVLEAAVFMRLAEAVMEDVAGLQDFSSAAHEQIRNEFVRHDQLQIASEPSRLARQLSWRSVPRGSPGPRVPDMSEMNLIEHIVSKPKSRVSIGELLRRSGAALQQLMPCFMMSPNSVAQYLSTSRGDLAFDLLIIDEASQMRPEQALGAVARARQIVVVGDDQQLPPSSFFDTPLEDMDDDTDYPESSEGVAPVRLEKEESVLRSAARCYSRRMLTWHYRSRHHGLIDFSNREFYHSRLIVFPAPQDGADVGIQFHPVTRAVYEPGNQTNRREADEVVAAVKRHARERPDDTLFIATLNAKQRDLIDGLIADASKTDSELESFLKKHDDETEEPFDVKNLENVQGDERDHVIVSVTFGPDANGKLSQNFGPINQADGHRRLNVLFTRARKTVTICCSFDPTTLRVDDASPRGLQVLQHYLCEASDPTAIAMDVSKRGFDSDFEIAVAEALASRGIDIVPQVGVAGYFIDLGVRHPEKPGCFILGVECDGDRYHRSRSARDRDRIRDSVLRDLGWNLVRIWSTDWFRDPHGQAERVEAEIRRLRRGPVRCDKEL